MIVDIHCHVLMI